MSQSPEGRELAKYLDLMRRRLAEVLLAQAGLPGFADEFDYQPMPPKRSFQMDVYVRMLGRGEPMPYVLNDDEMD